MIEIGELVLPVTPDEFNLFNKRQYKKDHSYVMLRKTLIYIEILLLLLSYQTNSMILSISCWNPQL